MNEERRRLNWELYEYYWYALHSVTKQGVPLPWPQTLSLFWDPIQLNYCGWQQNCCQISSINCHSVFNWTGWPKTILAWLNKHLFGATRRYRSRGQGKVILFDNDNFSIREPVRKKYGIFWEFFPNVGPHPPYLGGLRPKKNLRVYFAF